MAIAELCFTDGTPLSPEQIHHLENDLVTLAPRFRSKVSTKLYELGLHETARRIDNCGKFWRYHKCSDNGHVYSENKSRCMTHFGCERCAQRNAENLIEKFTPIGDVIGQFTLLTVTHTGARTVGGLKKMADQASRAIRRSSTADFSAIRILFNNSHAELRIIYAGPKEPTQALRKLWPQAHIKADLWTAAHFHCSLKYLMDPCLPASDEKRAVLEAAFKGTRALRVWGTLLRSTYLSSEPDNTNKPYIVPESEEHNPLECFQRNVPRCPKCNSVSKFVSQWVHADGPIPELQWEEHHGYV